MKTRLKRAFSCTPSTYTYTARRTDDAIMCNCRVKVPSSEKRAPACIRVSETQQMLKCRVDRQTFYHLDGCYSNAFLVMIFFPIFSLRLTRHRDTPPRIYFYFIPRGLGFFFPAPFGQPLILFRFKTRTIYRPQTFCIAKRHFYSYNITSLNFKSFLHIVSFRCKIKYRLVSFLFFFFFTTVFF